MSVDESEEVSVSNEDGFVTTTLTTQLTLSLAPPSSTDHGNDKYQIQYQDRCGRMLVATQLIKQGDTILIDTPACIGPDNNSRPVCLVCCTRLDQLHDELLIQNYISPFQAGPRSNHHVCHV